MMKMSTPIWTISPGTKPTVVDLSDNNAGFTTLAEFQALKAAGVTDVIHKITQGVSHVDLGYALRRPLALEAGLSWSAYHFCTAQPVEDQIAWMVKHYTPDLDKLKWLALDAEANRGSTIQPAQAAAMAQRLDQELAEVEKSIPLLRYGNASVLEYKQSGWHDGPMWWAKYGPEPTVEQMSALGIDPSNIILWQASATAHLAGRGPLDVSYERPAT
jgi:GH25 family lysozyme M1 (1,4-beta-N-acetylmuramidase)